MVVRTSVRDWTPNEYGLVFTQVMQLILLGMGLVIVMELSDNYPDHEPDYILKVFHTFCTFHRHNLIDRYRYSGHKLLCTF